MGRVLLATSYPDPVLRLTYSTTLDPERDNRAIHQKSKGGKFSESIVVSPTEQKLEQNSLTLVLFPISPPLLLSDGSRVRVCNRQQLNFLPWAMQTSHLSFNKHSWVILPSTKIYLEYKPKLSLSRNHWIEICFFFTSRSLKNVILCTHHSSIHLLLLKSTTHLTFIHIGLFCIFISRFRELVEKFASVPNYELKKLYIVFG